MRGVMEESKIWYSRPVMTIHVESLVYSTVGLECTCDIASFPVSTPQLLCLIFHGKAGEWRLGTRLLVTIDNRASIIYVVTYM